MPRCLQRAVRPISLPLVALLTSAAVLTVGAGITGASPAAASGRAPLHLDRGTYYRSASAVTRPPVVKARSWAVADLDTGAVLATHDRHAKLPQASTIKLLTAITAADRVPANPTHRVTSAEAHTTCTCAGLVVGQRYTRTALLAGMLLPSGNDAAEAMAGSD